MEMEPQAPEPQPPPMPEMEQPPEPEPPIPAPEPQDPAPERQPPMPEMEPQDPDSEPQIPAPEPQLPMPEMEPLDPAPEPQPPMRTRLEIVRFGGPIYARRGEKRTIAETVSESDDIHRAPSPLRPRTDPESDDIHRAPSPSPVPSPLPSDPESSSSQALDEFIDRCRIQDQQTTLLFLEDLLKELKRAGLSRFVKEEPNYRRNADSIFGLLEILRFEEGRDLKKKMEDIFSLYSQYTRIISFSCEQIFTEANIDDLMALREVSERETNLREVTPNSLHFEKLKAKKLEEEVAKMAQQINHLTSRINILKDALGAAERELKCSRDERVPYQTFTL